MSFLRYILPCLSCLVFCASPSSLQAADAFEVNKRLGRGMNLGNALEAPREGEWGVTLREADFDVIKAAGFDSVRIPIRWSTHTGPGPDFVVDAAFFERVDWAIDQALSRKMMAVVNVHHFEEIYRDPDARLPKLRAIWRQVAARYREKPDSLVFELLNEPNSALSPAKWNAMIPDLLVEIRKTNTDRVVVVGPGEWNNLRGLDRLQLPESDRALIVTFHYYEPFKFTHQGASWVRDSAPWVGTRWSGTKREKDSLARDFEQAAKWGREHTRPIYLGEFGSFSRADMDSRSRWTAAIVGEAKKHGFSWSYWEFRSGFGAFDFQSNSWRAPLHDALLADTRANLQPPGASDK